MPPSGKREFRNGKAVPASPVTPAAPAPASPAAVTAEELADVVVEASEPAAGKAGCGKQVSAVEVDVNEICVEWGDEDVDELFGTGTANSRSQIKADTGKNLEGSHASVIPAAPASTSTSNDKKRGEDGDAVEGDDTGSIICAIFTMLMSIPALVGAWCWPLLLAGAVSGLSSGLHFAGMKQITHSLTWGFNLMVLSNMTHFLVHKCSNHPVRKHRAHCAKYGPAYLCFLAMCLVMVDLTRHLVNDAFGHVCLEQEKLKNPSRGLTPELFGAFKAQDHIDELCYSQWALNQYNDDGSLSTWGWIGFLCTWIGFGILMISIFWGIDFHRKMRATWRKTRGRGGWGNGNRQQRAGTGPSGGAGSAADGQRRPAGAAPLLESA